MQADAADWPDRMLGHQAKPETARQHRDDDQHLRHRERGADADARPAGERDIGEARPRRGVFRREPVGIEMLGLAPQAAVAMHHPGQDRDDRARRHRVAAQRVGGAGLAQDGGDRRVEAHRLVEDLAGVIELRQLAGDQRPAPQYRVDLGVEPLFDNRIEGQQIPDPGQGPHRRRDAAGGDAGSPAAGGVSPTVRALTWIWYLLALNPPVEERLHAEIDAVLRGGPLVPSQLAQLNYTRQVLDETMRLYPPIPAILREARAADTLCGHPVPPRSVIAILPWVVHRHRRLWSEPEHFDPDRFTPENAAARPRFAYVPFAGGPRICVGASFAMTQMLIVVAMLARRFRFRLVPEHPIRPVGRISLHPFGGLRVRVERRETASADALNASLP